MPRELKFRAWDKDARCMVQVADISIDLHNDDVVMLWVKDAPDDNARTIYFDGFELMQFTGLHDKNGREIYEGDIVCYAHPASDEWLFGVVSFENGTFTVGRMWDDGTREWTSIEVLATPSMWENGKLVVPMEVIGNIYEHPELLEAQP